MWTGLIWLICGAVLVPVNTGYKVVEVLRPVVMKTSSFWDIAQFSPLKVKFRRKMSPPFSGFKN
jgi:hypothetical protein